MSIVIKADNLCKTYKIYNKRLDRLKETFSPFNKQYHSPFKALENINLEIKKGETVGIVGRNGSGKSTLLQIICGILQPTGGVINVNGRISALLELGAGFNPEFTGLENVYLNASILGLKKDEIDDCLDDILDFADIGRFVDQPVKTYSSGMYVRLAFAVAINVRPDILIVDEALSVGDTLFQAKCFAKFQEFQERGITILFVTHSTDLITRYCSSAILLDMGHLYFQGSAKAVVSAYNRLLAGCRDEEVSPMASQNSQNDGHRKPWYSAEVSSENEDRYGNGQAKIVDCGISDLNGERVVTLRHREEYVFWAKVVFHNRLYNPIVAYTIKDAKGLEIAGSNTMFLGKELGIVEEGNVVLVEFKQIIALNSGGFILSFGCSGFEDGEYQVYDRRFDVTAFDVVSQRSSVGIVDLNSKVEITYNITGN